jgi:hypothetical protein
LRTADICRGALLVDKTLTGLWPTDEDWRLLEYVLNQNVSSLFQNTKLIPVESQATLAQFIDKVFNLKNTWTQVLGFKWTASWQYDFLTFQLFFQFITLIRQTGVEGNHRQEVANRVLFGFSPTDSFPLKQRIKTEGWEAYKMVVDSTVNKAVKLSIISLEDKVDDKITLQQLKNFRTISEAITESRDLHISNDWGHIISEVINSYKKQKDFRLISEKDFVYKDELKPSKKPLRETDRYIDGQYHLHHVIANVLFNTQPGKEAVARHGLGSDHIVTQEGWNKTCREHAAWIGYQSSPHPVVSSLMQIGPLYRS